MAWSYQNKFEMESDQYGGFFREKKAIWNISGTKVFEGGITMRIILRNIYVQTL